MDAIRWGIIGCGDVTEVKSGPAFQKARRSELRAVMRRTASLAQDYAIRHHVPRWYSDANALIADEEIDAVYVATPPASHREYVLKCAEAGKPVYVEKPMSANYAAAKEMVDECRRADVPLFVAFYRRGMDYFNKVKKIIEEGIGELRTVTVVQYFQSRSEDSGEQQNWRVRPEISGGGRFLDLGSHTLDILDYILGPICDVSGMSGNLAGLYKPEDVVVAAFRFESGVFGTGLWCFCASHDEEQVVITGSAGQISFSVTDPRRLSVRTKQGDKELIFEIPSHVQQQLIQQVTDELTGRGKCLSTGETALRTSYVMDKILGRL